MDLVKVDSQKSQETKPADNSSCLPQHLRGTMQANLPPELLAYSTGLSIVPPTNSTNMACFVMVRNCFTCRECIYLGAKHKRPVMEALSSL